MKENSKKTNTLEDAIIRAREQSYDLELKAHLDGYAKQIVIKELEMISTKFVIEIGEDGDYDYQNEISLHEVLERIIELKEEV
jgi:hypothetical protein|tara:strand:- start:5601 stop:5849 length:249 start_codon:yes stop_codon:yes gene_type:complete